MTKTRTARTPRGKQASPAESIGDRVRAKIAEDEEHAEIVAEITRLRCEQAAVQAELDQAMARATDVDSLVDQIEAGQELRPEDSVRIQMLRDQCRAYALAVQRAERRRQEILAVISQEQCEEFAALHRSRLEKMVETMASMSQQIDALPQIPNILKGHGLGGDPTVYPIFHWNELMQLKPKFNHFSRGYQIFLSGGDQ